MTARSPSPFRQATVAGISALLFATFAVTAAAAAPEQQALSLTLQPGPLNPGQDIDSASGSVAITLKIPHVHSPAGAPLLMLPLVVDNVETVAASLQALSASDDLGLVSLHADDQPGAGATVRHWSATRAVQGDLVVHYQAPFENAPPLKGAAPPYSLRTEGGGFSGVGNIFLLLPETAKTYPLALHWDLSRLAPNSSATSSYGEGDVTLPNGAATRLWSTIFMAGPMRRVPARVAPGGFSSAWLGTPSFDPAPLMTWGGQLHQWMSDFFGDASEPPYRVFLRYNPINAGGGTALTQSFLITYGKDISANNLKLTLSHEMVHTWTAGADAAWYDEGIAVHYQALLPFRAGLITPDEFLADLNATAARYYADALNTTPDAAIMAHFWEDTRIRTLPYDRGAMYFAVIDARLRLASGGSKSLDDLVMEMNRYRDKPQEMAALWPKLLARELGDSGTALHAAMLAGQVIVPDSDAFGPCFERSSKTMRRFELGFEPKSLVGNVKTIRGLIAGSEADKAGLHDGDVVTYAVAMDTVQSEPAHRLTLAVTRDGKQFSITYLPRGESVGVWQWRRTKGMDDGACSDTYRRLSH